MRSFVREGLVEQERTGDRDVDRVGDAVHGYRDDFVGDRLPFRREPVAFRSQHDGDTPPFHATTRTLPPRWTRGAKEAVGTAYSSSSRVWYTIAAGVLTEIFYPTIDTPQIRDLQFLVTDGRTFFHDERRNTQSQVACIDEASLGFSIVNKAQDGRYRLHKTVISHPHQDCVLMRTRVEADEAILPTLQLYILCAPHLEVGGWHNNTEVLDTRGGRIFVMWKGRTWAALGCTSEFRRCSCGYVAVNDGWTDLHDNFMLDWEYDVAFDGNVAVTGEIDLAQGTEFTIGLAFGDTRHRAITNLLQSLVLPFDDTVKRFQTEWDRTRKRFALVANHPDQARRSLYQRSVNLLLAHEDKRYPGAFIAALSIPWGTAKGDEEMGGYHLVWTRDLVQVATALLAAGARPAEIGREVDPDQFVAGGVRARTRRPTPASAWRAPSTWRSSSATDAGADLGLTTTSGPAGARSPVHERQGRGPSRAWTGRNARPAASSWRSAGRAARDKGADSTSTEMRAETRAPPAA